jgi:hypothetical protein
MGNSTGGHRTNPNSYTGERLCNYRLIFVIEVIVETIRSNALQATKRTTENNHGNLFIDLEGERDVWRIRLFESFTWEVGRSFCFALHIPFGSQVPSVYSLTQFSLNFITSIFHIQ